MDDFDKLNRIIAASQQGSEDAFSQLVDIYANRCYGYFYRLTGNVDLSNDLLGDLFVRLVEKIGMFRSGSFEKWLFAIASNIFYDYLRGQYRQKKLIEGTIREIESQGPGKEVDGEILDELQIALGRLDGETKELLMLRFYSELSFKQIAQMRSEPIGTTLSKVHRGLKKLREMMNK